MLPFKKIFPKPQEKQLCIDLNLGQKKTDVNLANYKKQQTFFVTLLWRTKKDYIENLKVKNFSKNKKLRRKEENN